MNGPAEQAEILAWLDELAQGPDPDQAAEALENCGAPQVSLLPTLAARLRESSEADVQYWCATLLGRLDAAAAPAAPALIHCLERSPHLAARERSVWALGRIGPAAWEAVSPLYGALVSGQPRLARLAQEALERILPGGLVRDGER